MRTTITREMIELTTVKRCPIVIQLIENQTEELQLASCKKDGTMLQYIEPISVKVIDVALMDDG